MTGTINTSRERSYLTEITDNGLNHRITSLARPSATHSSQVLREKEKKIRSMKNVLSKFNRLTEQKTKTRPLMTIELEIYSMFRIYFC